MLQLPAGPSVSLLDFHIFDWTVWIIHQDIKLDIIICFVEFRHESRLGNGLVAGPIADELGIWRNLV